MEAMQSLPPANLAIALVAFTAGVELAHQLLIVPLFFIVRFARGGRTVEGGEAEPSPPAVALHLPWPLRVASGAISVAGMFYLVGALRGA
jgi:hypothetical protein